MFSSYNGQTWCIIYKIYTIFLMLFIRCWMAVNKDRTKWWLVRLSQNLHVNKTHLIIIIMTGKKHKTWKIGNLFLIFTKSGGSNWCNVEWTLRIITDGIVGSSHWFTMRSQDPLMMSSEDHYTCLHWGMRSQDSLMMSSEDHYTCLQWGHKTH